MKIGVISQRMDKIESYDEIRDAIDISWHKLFAEMDAALIPMPNVPASFDILLERSVPDFIVLSGGNTPVCYGGNAPRRDAIDEKLISYAISKQIPLLGVCRGAQSIGLYFHSTLKKVEGHIAVTHFVHGEINRMVNSYHGYAIDFLGNGLHILARGEQGEIEAFSHEKYPIYGIMWHPERVHGFDEEDIELISKWLSL